MTVINKQALASGLCVCRHGLDFLPMAFPVRMIHDTSVGATSVVGAGGLAFNSLTSLSVKFSRLRELIRTRLDRARGSETM